MPAPVAGRRPPRQRLDTIKATVPAPSQQSTPRDSPQPAAAPARNEPCCNAPEFDRYSDTPLLCQNCGRSKAVESTLQAEITFGETSSGAAMVVGGFVGDDQRHANTMGGNMRGLTGIDSREKTLYRGKDEIAKLVAALRLRQVVSDQAVRLYRIALNHNFVQGRRVRNVAACCIYLADRKQPESTLFLIDLAEKVRVNVWTLGDTYKQFLAITYNEDPANAGSMNRLPELEPLVLKFCRKLEFGFDSHRVAEDACRLIKRMKRDWMVDGRQPAGVIGAAIILAARMNNFRRTVREVVYCVKVADSTIHHRLHEFKRTRASDLSVKQMREVGHLLKDDILPPAIYKREEKEERKRKRLARALEAMEEEDFTADEEVVATSTTTKSRRPAKKRKTTKRTTQSTGSEGLIEEIALPGADPESDRHLDAVAMEHEEVIGEEGTETAAPVPKKRGRPPKKRAPIIIAPEDLEIEAEIEGEMQDHMQNWQNIFKEFDQNEEHPVYKDALYTAQAMIREHVPDRSEEQLDREHVDEEEFLDDEDVMNCVNTPEEVALKEKVWITENEDWLRDQQAKLLAKELEDASGKPKKVKRTRKRAIMGDGSVLDGKAASSAADATQKMLERRAKFSSHIDYEVVQALLGPRDDEEEESSAGSVSATAGAAAPRKADDAEVVEIDEDYDEDEPQQHYQDDYVDDTNMYMSDDDVGFEEIDDNF